MLFWPGVRSRGQGDSAALLGAVAVAVQSGRPTVLPTAYTDMAHLERTEIWETPGVFYNVRSALGNPQAAAIVTELVRQSAFPERPPCASIDPASMGLEDLVTKGLVEQRDNGFALARKGVGELITGTTCSSPRSLTSLPAGPFEEMDTWQLLLWMRHQGWQWQKYHKRLEPYRTGQPLIWSTSGWSGRSLHIEYLLALITFDELHAEYPDITEVPHTLDKKTYRRMLRGQAPPDMIAFADLDPEEEHAVVAAGEEAARGEEHGVLEDALPEQDADEVGSIEPPESECSDADMHADIGGDRLVAAAAVRAAGPGAGGRDQPEPDADNLDLSHRLRLLY